jgi:hypothetical protein
MMNTLAGKYKLSVYSCDNALKYQTNWFDNMITDIGLNQVGISSFLTHCYIGSGTSVPSPTQVALAHQVGAPTTTILSSSTTASTTSPYGGRIDISYKFPVGTATGNLSEVGVGWADALFSRSLILDNDGNPVTITILPNEFLIVSYQLVNYAPAVDGTFDAMIVDVSRQCVMRASNVLSGGVNNGWGISGNAIRNAGENSIIAYDGELGLVTQQPNGNWASANTIMDANYSNNSKEKTIIATWNGTSANFATGISAFFFSAYGLGSFQFSVTPPIQKNVDDILSMSFKVTWGR